MNGSKILQSFGIGLASASISIVLYFHSQDAETDLSFYLSIITALAGSILSLNWSDRKSNVLGFVLSILVFACGFGGYAYIWHSRINDRFVNPELLSILDEEYQENSYNDVLKAYVKNSSQVDVGEVKITINYLSKDSVIHRYSEVVQKRIPRNETREVTINCGSLSGLNERLGVDGIKVRITCAHQNAGMHCR